MPKTEQKQRDEGRGRVFPATIMVVDDDPFVREILVAALSAADQVSVRAFASGEDAVKAAPSIHPDLVLLDFMMPGLDGPQTWEALRKTLDREPEVIFLTAKDLTDVDARLGKTLASQLISKPFDPLTVVDQIRQVLKLDGDGSRSSSRLDDAKTRFRENLAKQAEALDATHRQFAAGQGAPDAVRNLLERVHKLAGSAGLFQFDAINTFANNLESLVSDFIRTNGESTTILSEELMQGINVLADECRRQAYPRDK